MKKKNLNKLFIVRKYVWALDAKDAIRKEAIQVPDDVWIDEKWKENSSNPKDAIGFYSNEAR